MSVSDARPIPEFVRTLSPSKHIPHLHHLALVLDKNQKPVILQSQKPHYSPLDISSFFGTPGPIEIEIGCGKGSFFVDYCENHPQAPFLAVEKEYEYAALAAKRIAKRKHLPHVRTVVGDGYYLIRDFLSAQSIKAFHIYFPDPWPKKRHNKRRLLTPGFMEQIKRTAISNATLFWGTDHQPYHEMACEIFQNTPWLRLLNAEADPTEGIMTNFEKKYRKEGRPIFRHQYTVL